MQELAERVYNEHQSKIDDAIMNSKTTPRTLGILKQFSIVNDGFSKILESLQSIENFYSSQAISRITIEHFLIAYYILTKCRLENNDECAQDYWNKYCYSFIKPNLERTHSCNFRTINVMIKFVTFYSN